MSRDPPSPYPQILLQSHNIVVRRLQNVVAMFVNGTYEAQSQEITNKVLAGQSLTIGGSMVARNGDDLSFKGTLDDVRIYSRALSNFEIQQLSSYQSRPEDFLFARLVAYFPFNGTANDESGNGNDGAVHGAVPGMDRFGNPTGALYFDGNGAYLNATVRNAPLGNANRTLSVWFKSATANALNFPAFVSYGSGNCTNKQFGIGSYLHKLHFWGGCDDAVSGLVFDDETWHLATIVYQDDAIRCYLDGQESASFTALPEGSMFQTNRFVLGPLSTEPGEIIAGAFPPWNLSFKGYLDDLRLYSRALSSQESLALYNREKPLVPAHARVLSLSGDGSYVVIPSAAALQSSNSITLETWLYGVQTSNNPTPYFLSKGDGLGITSARSYDLQWSKDEQALFSIYTGRSAMALLVGSAPRGRWTHIAATFDSSVGLFTLYTNGLLAGSTTVDVTGQIPLKGQPLRQTGLPLNLGGYPSVPGSFAAGYLDEVRIWSRALTQDEIRDHLHSRLIGTETDLAAYWTFDDGSAQDVTGNGHEGILMGSATPFAVTGFDLVHAAIGFTDSWFTRRGLVVLELEARTGTLVRIDASTNLLDWQPLTTTTTHTKSIQFTDPDTLKFDNRFYRGVIQP